MSQSPCPLYRVENGVAVTTLSQPPVNPLSHAVRSAIVEGVDRAHTDVAVRAIVIVGAGRYFSAGADMREFGTSAATQEPTLSTVLRILDDTSKPVIAAIEGVAMGGGLELALACHYRVAQAGTQVALPEVKRGILPGAGGTQRLPRLLGVEAALDMIVTGKTVTAAALGAPLFDRVVDGEVLSAALALAQEVADSRPLPRVRDRQVKLAGADAFFQHARRIVQARSPNLPAPLKCVDAVAAALEPFDIGLPKERAMFVELSRSPEARALQHGFFAEREAPKIPALPAGTQARDVQAGAVIGAGTMGGGIAMNFANAGIPVWLLETSQEALDRGLGIIRRNYETSAKKGRLTEAQVDQRMALIRPTLQYADIAQADVVIEAVFEDWGVKETVFRTLDEVMKPGAILATNTSTLDVNRIAAFTRRPQDVVGLHFFSPANVMRLLEVVQGAATAPDVIATAMALAKRFSKVGVLSGVCDGFIGNRMLDRYIRQAHFLLEEGALPEQVDRALEKFGMAMGPCRMNDMVGNDIGWAIRKRRYVEYPDQAFARVADPLCEAGRLGQKAGKGWYRYEPGKRDPIPDPEVRALIEAYSAQHGITRRRISDQEIVERTVFALVNEGARLLEEGIAQRASDLDAVFLTGYGFPAFRGGPMHYAESVGLFNVLRAIRGYAARGVGGGAFWTPAPLLERCVAEGRGFADLT
ncbi:3-hydroxyacyl-CoA dehydrogenase NAD-binding domain-containing protein [Imbroritus primus]|uniref:3-hydroxyacyl-CoA dehydrogenase NAD-binding domain-containing protein n=1 Tax=Imbroritus primus TaxID=3058603 RepID=UPI003D16042C